MAARVTSLALLLAATLGCAQGQREPQVAALRELTINPSAMRLRPGEAGVFHVTGRSRDGSAVAVEPMLLAFGGSISSQGRYVAGSFPGEYVVIAAQRGGTLADTALVTIASGGGPGYTSYATSFPLTENPISERGRWVTGSTVGLDWSDVSTVRGRAVGLQTGAHYTDATAIVAGEWGPDQSASAVVFTSRQDDDCYQEVELRLRTAIRPHRITGYEIGFKMSRTSQAYLIIVRWNGPLGDFTYLFNERGKHFAVKDGDRIRAEVRGNVITAFKNGTRLARVVDDRIRAGSPGIGFNLVDDLPRCRGSNGDYGFTSFAAWDSVGR